MGLSDTNELRDFILRERMISVSEREWKFRLRGYGYGIRDTDEGHVVTSLLGNRDLCTLGA